MNARRALLIAALFALGASVTVPCRSAEGPTPTAAGPRAVDFNREIRPILAGSCFNCHGPDEKSRQADLRLDDRTAAVEESKAIVPGKAAESPLIQRVASDDPDELMPPPESKKPRLPPARVELLRRWIDEGAKYQSHWAYAKPQRPAVPAVRDAAWPRNPIDRFVAAGHQARGLAPQSEADRRTLIRRLSFDLRGLPPTPAEVEAFAADRSPDAYELLVERLLAAPQYGERMAAYWLDVVRYADSGGYHSDNERSVWLLRDYVIRSFNDNLPFDRFTIEQLAGDLLPGASDWQRIASGYNRLLQTTEEGGAQPKEYTAKYAADRVRNTATAWLGVTLGCAQCHDHKYDPFTTRDFYSFAAFFADVQESPVGRQPQTPLPSAEQAAALAQLNGEMAPLQQALDTATPELAAAQAEWEKQLSAEPPPPDKAKLPKDIAQIVAVAAEKRTPEQQQKLAAHYRGIAPALAATRQRLAELKRRKDELEKQIPTMLITTAGPPRVTRILPRGNWMDDSGEIVLPAVPAALGELADKQPRATRRDLAEWLVAPDNPLVARVFVNRLWKLYFGQGIVRTLEDCGTQGAPPTHPELLDWLAVEFIENGWRVKHIVRLIVASQTYRQSSVSTPELDRHDPANQWLARQGRFRLEAEMIRDTALSISGLLVLKVGGPSLKPYQPAGYWEFLNFPKREWASDRGENQYRRGLYTFWQRTLLHPSLLAFDASTREESTPDRPRSNTPLQALRGLKDQIYFEDARAFAARIVREGGASTPERLRFAFRAALQRGPTAEEETLLAALVEKHLKAYRGDLPAAQALLRVGDAPPPEGADAAELAAWTSAARAVLNLHETLTRL